MLGLLKKKIRHSSSLYFFCKSPLKWLYSAYLTVRFVDKHQCFPAFEIRGNVDLKIKKQRGAKLDILNKVIFEQWNYGRGRIVLTMLEEAHCLVENDFLIGNGVNIFLDKKASLTLKGKLLESGSGITANSVIMVNKKVVIGYDCIIAWDTFITDCDWHNVGGGIDTKTTYIGDHVWIGVGAKILKGVEIGKNSIIPALSVVLQGQYPEKSLLSGNPAKVIKENISAWCREKSV